MLDNTQLAAHPSQEPNKVRLKVDECVQTICKSFYLKANLFLKDIFVKVNTLSFANFLEHF